MFWLSTTVPSPEKATLERWLFILSPCFRQSAPCGFHERVAPDSAPLSGFAPATPSRKPLTRTLVNGRRRKFNEQQTPDYIQQVVDGLAVVGIGCKGGFSDIPSCKLACQVRSRRDYR
jgi:hypothetical protein